MLKHLQSITEAVEGLVVMAVAEEIGAVEAVGTATKVHGIMSTTKIHYLPTRSIL